MKLGIMQPYFFPYLGYFDLINCTDKWVVFDTPQYIRHGWVNRNRILHPKSGWQYIKVPLAKHARDTSIKDIVIAENDDWKDLIVRQLQHYKKLAPFFEATTAFVQDCLSIDETSLSRLNVNILDRVCAKLGISFDYTYFSQMDMEIGPIEGPGDWALEISKATGASTYINPSGGEDLFEKEKFEREGIELIIKQFDNLQYQCHKYEFVSALSIIDVLMWNEIHKIKECLDSGKTP